MNTKEKPHGKKKLLAWFPRAQQAQAETPGQKLEQLGIQMGGPDPQFLTVAPHLEVAENGKK